MEQSTWIQPNNIQASQGHPDESVVQSSSIGLGQISENQKGDVKESC